MSQLLQELRDSAKAEGHDRIYTHGEPEIESLREKEKHGIPTSDKTVEELIGIGRDLDLDYYDYICENS